jgi:uncharacterized protein YjbI with pentapeptide repeats
VQALDYTFHHYSLTTSLFAVIIELRKGEEIPVEDQKTQPQKIQDSPSPKERRTSRSRAIWEWLGFGEDGEKTGLDLLQVVAAVSIPVAVVIMGSIFTASQSRSQQQAEEKRAQAQQDVEEQRAQEVALQSYLEQMANLLMDEGLSASEEGDEVRTLARSRTLTTLSRVDAAHKKSIVQFLHESKLIQGDQPIVMLQEADLREAELLNVNLDDTNLIGANLSNADLRLATLHDANLIGANLIEADLREANLIEANLSLAHLSGADLSDAYLRDAALIGVDLSNTDLSDAEVTQAQLDDAGSLAGATMPDGSKHD